MDSILRKGLSLVTLTGALTAFPITVYAADDQEEAQMPSVGMSIRFFM